MSIKKIKSIHKIGEKFEVKNPFIKVPCDNHEFEIISVDNNIDVKISKIPQSCIETDCFSYNFRHTVALFIGRKYRKTKTFKKIERLDMV